MNFDYAFCDKEIIKAICRLRIKYARIRSKKQIVHQCSTDRDLDHHSRVGVQERALRNILPSRRSWLKLKKHQRYSNGGNRLSSIEINNKSLYWTVRRDLALAVKPSYIDRLLAFVSEVQNAAFDVSQHPISSPIIIPKIKGELKPHSNKFRPLSQFGLRDRIVLSQTNRYLSKYLDTEFQSCSFAFRSSRWDSSGKRVQPTHHDAIRHILKHRRKQKDNIIWVSECDLKGFFDTVSHTIIKKRFDSIISKIEKKTGGLCDARAIRILYSYLDSYSFTRNVLPLNKDNAYWSRFGYPKDSVFKWPKDDFLAKGLYKQPHRAKVGIPQGGALSGLISNIVLHSVDKRVLNVSRKVSYVRFCDDMLILGPSRNICTRALECYVEGISRAKLLSHDFIEVKHHSGNEFWSQKSKRPYKWGCLLNEKRWIGFVGYEIRYDGLLRVRKSSLKKEIDKQKAVVRTMLSLAQNSTIRVSKKRLLESIIHQLIGMSVGRIELWNVNAQNYDMCWVNGFIVLKEENCDIRQIKLLDQLRNRLVSDATKKLGELPEFKSVTKKSQPRRKIINYYGKPFSYFFHIVE